MRVNTVKLGTLNIPTIQPPTETEVQSPRLQVGAGVGTGNDSQATAADLPAEIEQQDVTPRVSPRQSYGAGIAISKPSLDSRTKPDFITQVEKGRTPQRINIENARKRLEEMKTVTSSTHTIPPPPKPPKYSKFTKYCCGLFSCFLPPSKSEPIPMKQVANSTRDVVLKTTLLPPPDPTDGSKKLLILDLDETLVHSSFKPVENSDFIIDVEIEGTVHKIFVLLRPRVHEFLRELADHYEIAVFTASLSKYANPVLDLLDKEKIVRHRLFREHCVQHKGNYVKDLNLLGRDLRHIIIIDNSPTCYMFHPNNAVPISSWFDDLNDEELIELLPFLKELKDCADVTKILDSRI